MVRVEELILYAYIYIFFVYVYMNSIYSDLAPPGALRTSLQYGTERLKDKPQLTPMVPNGTITLVAITKKAAYREDISVSC